MTDSATKTEFDFSKLSPQQKGQLLFQKAVKLHNENELEEALKYYTQAVAFFPELSDAYNNMAVALRKLCNYQAALACYKKSLHIRPDHGGTYSNMGNVLNDLDRLDESLNAHRRAVELAPDNLLFQYNLALVLRDAGQSAEAIDLFTHILQQDPNYRDCRWDRAITYLMAGDLKNGFHEYDARWELAKSPPRKFAQPRWMGEPLDGRTLFIHREQGFGDAIQFARFMPMIKEMFGNPTIILECQPELVRLFQGVDGIDQILPFGKQPPAFDVWIPMLSLGHILQLDESRIATHTPYLKQVFPPRLKIKQSSPENLNIGIVWGGSPTHQNDRRRSVGIDRFIPMAEHQNVSIFSLQKGAAEKELVESGARCLFVDAGKELKDFADTAGLINQLDLIITIDTSVAHLAGALGKEVWVLLPYTPDWRWMWEREDSPWYPTMRLFRQDEAGDWDSCFKKLYHVLEEKLSARKNTAQD